MAASENELGTLHKLVARFMMSKLEAKDENGNPLCTAADVSNILKYLKDNNITCAPAEDNEVGELAAALNKRKKAAGPMPPDLQDALDSIGKIGNLH